MKRHRWPLGLFVVANTPIAGKLSYCCCSEDMKCGFKSAVLTQSLMQDANLVTDTQDCQPPQRQAAGTPVAFGTASPQHHAACMPESPQSAGIGQNRCVMHICGWPHCTCGLTVNCFSFSTWHTAWYNICGSLSVSYCCLSLISCSSFRPDFLGAS